MAIDMNRRQPAGGPVRLGLRANWPQFVLLVVVNVFVGGMVGLERATTSLVGTRVFHVSGYLAVEIVHGQIGHADLQSSGSFGQDGERHCPSVCPFSRRQRGAGRPHRAAPATADQLRFCWSATLATRNTS